MRSLLNRVARLVGRIALGLVMPDFAVLIGAAVLVSYGITSVAGRPFELELPLIEPWYIAYIIFWIGLSSLIGRGYEIVRALWRAARNPSPVRLRWRFLDNRQVDERPFAYQPAVKRLVPSIRTAAEGAARTTLKRKAEH